MCHTHKNFKALDQGLMLKKVHRVIIFNENLAKTIYVDMNAELRKSTKTDFWQDFSSWWIMLFQKKITENVRKLKDIKLVTNEAIRN